MSTSEVEAEDHRSASLDSSFAEEGDESVENRRDRHGIQEAIAPMRQQEKIKVLPTSPGIPRCITTIYCPIGLAQPSKESGASVSKEGKSEIISFAAGLSPLHLTSDFKFNPVFAGVQRFEEASSAAMTLRELSSLPKLPSLENQCSSVPTKCAALLMENCRSSLLMSHPSTACPVPCHFTTSSASSCASYSTLLSSDSSSMSSLMSGVTHSSLFGVERVVASGGGKLEAASVAASALSNMSYNSDWIGARQRSRRKSIKRISRGSPQYQGYLLRQESIIQSTARSRLQEKRRLCAKKGLSTLAAMKQAEEELKNCHTLFVRKYSNDKNDSVAASYQTESLIQVLQRNALFEWYHSLPGMSAMIMYCIAHISCYELFSNLHLSIFWSSEHPRIIHGLCLLLGLCMIRLSGCVWNWLNEDSYKEAQLDIRNKLRLRHFDARILRWIRHHPMVRLGIDICGVYLCFIAVGYVLNEELMPSFCDIRDDVRSELPSLQHSSIPTFTKELLGVAPIGVSKSIEVTNAATHARIWECIASEQCCDVDAMEVSQVKNLLETEDEEYLFGKLSLSSYFNLFGWEKTTLVSTQCQVGFNALNALVSMAILFQAGVGFWDD